LLASSKTDRVFSLLESAASVEIPSPSWIVSPSSWVKNVEGSVVAVEVLTVGSVPVHVVSPGVPGVVEVVVAVATAVPVPVVLVSPEGWVVDIEVAFVAVEGLVLVVVEVLFSEPSPFVVRVTEVSLASVVGSPPKIITVVPIAGSVVIPSPSIGVSPSSWIKNVEGSVVAVEVLTESSVPVHVVSPVVPGVVEEVVAVATVVVV